MVSEKIVLSFVLGSLLVPLIETLLYTQSSRHTDGESFEMQPTFVANCQGAVMFALTIVVWKFDFKWIGHRIGLFCSWAYLMFVFIALNGWLLLLSLILHQKSNKWEDNWLASITKIIFWIHGLATSIAFSIVSFHSYLKGSYFHDIRQARRRVRNAARLVKIIRIEGRSGDILGPLSELLGGYEDLDWSPLFWKKIFVPILNNCAEKLPSPASSEADLIVCRFCSEQIIIGEKFSSIPGDRYNDPHDLHIDCIVRSRNWFVVNEIVQHRQQLGIEI